MGRSSGAIYTDADCGFCQRSALWVPRIGVRARVLRLQDEDLVGAGIDPDRALLEMAWRGDDGEVLYGHRAWAAALGTGPAPWRLVGRVLGSHPVAPLASRFYRWVADNRYRLPGGSPACRID